MRKKYVSGIFRTCGATLLLAVYLGTTGCSDEKKTTALPPAKGAPYELLLVMNGPVWNSAMRDSVQQIFDSPMPGLPQVESLFRLIRLKNTNYSNTYAMMRNTVFVEINDSLPAPRTDVTRNRYAARQLMVRVSAPDLSSLNCYLNENKQTLTDLLVDNELQVETARLNGKYSQPVRNAARSHMGLDIRVPTDIKSVKTGKDFLWASTNRAEKDLNLILYTCPLPPEGGLPDTSYFIQMRDSILKANIPGSTPEQWMTTTHEAGQALADTRVVRINGRHALEARGLWEMHNGGIGGPFVALAYADTTAHRLTVAEGFVYSPQTEKRNLIRTLEAALRTLKAVGSK